MLCSRHTNPREGMHGVLQRDCHPAYFFLCAATAYADQRREVQRMRDARLTTPGARSLAPPEVRPSKGVGQLEVPHLQGVRRLTDPEFLAWLEVSCRSYIL